MAKKTKGSLSSNNKKHAGVHLIADFWNGKIVEEPKKIEKILFAAAKRANNTPLKISVHKFSPHGLTAVILLAESHIAIHNWPEFKYLAIDIFTCGDQSMPYKALEYLREVFRPEKTEIRELKRGRMR